MCLFIEDDQHHNKNPSQDRPIACLRAFHDFRKMEPFINAGLKVGVKEGLKYRIKLCLLLWLGFFKTMKLLLSVRRDLSVRCREIILVLNRVQSTDFRR